MRAINRIVPAIGSENMKTYQIVAPLSTHFRKATCEEVECRHYINGWKTIIDERTAQGQGQAHYIRRSSGRRFTEERDAAGLTVFKFEAGQVCFKASEHRMRLDRPEIYIVKDGDFRGNPRGTRSFVHVNSSDWVEDFATHQDNIIRAQERG